MKAIALKNARTCSWYRRLNSIVQDKVVLVVGPSIVSEKIDSMIDDRKKYTIIRLNNDQQPCDIFATTFAKDVEASVPPGAQLILMTVPSEEMSYLSPIDRGRVVIRDWSIDCQRYQGLIPIESVSPVHWRLLASLMPVFPLSGLVLLSMLSTTSFTRCEVHGFDFYTGVSRKKFYQKVGHQFLPSKPYFLMHDYLAAISWLNNLIRIDPRFSLEGKLNLEEIRKEVRWRVAYICFWQLLTKLRRIVNRNVGRMIHK